MVSGQIVASSTSIDVATQFQMVEFIRSEGDCGNVN